MSLLQAAPVHVTDREREFLQTLIRQRTCPQQISLRARIILLAADGRGVRETAAELRIGRTTVQGWRRRWTASAEGSVQERLSDAPRSGTPPTFTPEQICTIIALACEPPTDSGREMTHWTQRELADEAVKRGYVDSISPHSVGRFLKSGAAKAASHSRVAERDTR